jgi:hypothetical protein
MLLAGFCASFLVQALLGRGGEPMGFAPRALLSLGCTQLMIGAVWCAVWGTADMVRIFLLLPLPPPPLSWPPLLLLLLLRLM